MTTHENNIPKVINAYKEVGETPLEVVELLKSSSEELKDTPITYAGRLDPMAEGVLLLLVGDEVHKKEEYLKLDKEYVFQVLFGFSTDTYDLLGRVTDSENVVFNKEAFLKTLTSFVGKQNQEYPPYSSKTVDGKPLFTWAREGRLHEIDIPTHEIEIYSLESTNVETISVLDLKEEIRERIAAVKGDFRQKETIELWNAYIDTSENKEFVLASVSATCSSGTYVRALVHDVGKKLNTPATTFSIVRSKVGDYSVE